MQGEIIGLILSLLLLASVVLAAHYLTQIRDMLRDMAEVQKRVARKLGCNVDRR